MEDAPNWPAVADRYDPYDPRHPMWADRFWGEYCRRPAAPPAPTASDPLRAGATDTDSGETRSARGD